MEWQAPFLIMILDVQWASGPGAAGQGTRRVGGLHEQPTLTPQSSSRNLTLRPAIAEYGLRCKPRRIPGCHPKLALGPVHTQTLRLKP